VVLNDFADTLRLAGRVEEAVDLFERALALSLQGKYLMRQADAHVGLGRCFADQDVVRAQRHWAAALELHREMDMPRQHMVEAVLRNSAVPSVARG
jgi:tetratricopeptide (TPR) repeat protein